MAWFPTKPLFLFIVLGAVAVSFFVWVLLFILFRRGKSSAASFKFSGITPEMIEEAIAKGKEKLSQLDSYAPRIEDKNIKHKLKDICGVINKILDDLRIDPKDLSVAKQFLNYYLDATLKILKRYVEITETGVYTSKQKALVQRFGSTLDMIKSAFEKQLSRLLENDFLDLDAEIKLFESTVNMEGLVNEDD